jgi:hypothetical protein
MFYEICVFVDRLRNRNPEPKSFKNHRTSHSKHSHYLEAQNNSETSISLNVCSLPRENARARSSARLERRTLNP